MSTDNSTDNEICRMDAVTLAGRVKNKTLSAVEVMVPSAAITTDAFCTDPEVTITPAVGPAALAPDTAERGPDSAFSAMVPLASWAEAFGVRLPSVTPSAVFSSLKLQAPALSSTLRRVRTT